jgi:hypothetical protein
MHILAADVQPLAFNWAFNKWLVVIAILAAGALVFYLYRAQQRIASRRLVGLLTAIRLTLIVLMFVLLAGPVYQWRHTRDNSGTLWLVMDQSLSMDHADGQMTPAERLQWADALGLLPEGARPGKLDRHIAELAALRAQLVYLASRAQLPTTDAQELQKQRDASAERIKNLCGQIERETDAIARIVPLDSPAKIDKAIAALKPLSDQAAAKFISEKQADAKVQEALAKVAAMKRTDLAVAALTQKLGGADAAFIESLPKHDVKLVAFSDAPLPVAGAESSALASAIKTSLKPAGHSTDLAGALRWLNEQIGEGERATVVIVSDGRHNRGGTGRADLVEPSRLLAARDVRVFTVAIGSEQVAPDATVEQIDAPDWIYKDDTLRTAALLRLDGLAQKPVTVEFRRAGVAEALKSESITPQTPQATKLVRFEDKPKDVGALEYEIAIKPVEGETLAANNVQRFRVTAKRDRLNALVIDDQPRWEFRYLTNYLERDQRVKLQKVLFAPATVAAVERPQPVMASPANESPEAQLLPDTLDKWSAFNLIVVGDVAPQQLGAKQQEFLAKTVKDRGAALIFIAGASNMPARYTPADAKALHELLPVELVSSWNAQDLSAYLKDGFRPVIAPDGVSSVLTQFTPAEALNAELWSSLPPWYWHSPQTRAKLASSVVWAIAEPGKPGPGGLTLAQARQRTLLATMPMGLGRVMYLAGDSTWRLRQVAGENLHERFWGQVVRWAVGNELPAGGRLVKFGADKPRYVAGEPVTITARLLDPASLAPLSGKDVKAVAKDGANKRLNETPLVELPAGSGVYKGTMNALPAGRIELSLSGKQVEDNLAADPTVVSKSLAIDVLPHRDDEQANVNTDFAALARVAEAGGGFAVRGPHAAVVPAHLPQLSFTAENVEQAGLFSNPRDGATKLVHWAFMIAFITLLTAEWVIRKAGGLV